MTADLTKDSLSVRLAQGNIYLSRELYDAYFSGITSIALIERSGAVLIVPLKGDSAGGLLLKQRNARGDRVVHAQEFMRNRGIADGSEPRTLGARWNDANAALEFRPLVLTQS